MKKRGLNHNSQSKEIELGGMQRRSSEKVDTAHQQKYGTEEC